MITDTGQHTPLPLYALAPGPSPVQYDLSPMVRPLMSLSVLFACPGFYLERHKPVPG